MPRLASRIHIAHHDDAMLVTPHDDALLVEVRASVALVMTSRVDGIRRAHRPCGTFRRGASSRSP
jgi:hypothetical protein